MVDIGDCYFEVGRFAGEPNIMKFRDFLSVASSSTYLFDSSFETGTNLTEDYSVPSAFQKEISGAIDLIQELPDYLRPDYRWLLIGCEGSGLNLK